SERPGGWSEPSGTIVHRVFSELGAELRVVLWNTVPHHPHDPGRPLSNRRPTVAEGAAGAVFVERVLDLLQPRPVVAVGRTAEGVPGDGAVCGRKRASGGGPAFASGRAGAMGPAATSPPAEH